MQPNPANNSEITQQNPLHPPVQKLEGDFFARLVKWLRSDSESMGESALKVGTYALGIILTISLVGLFVVIPTAIEWYRQANVVQNNNPNSQPKISNNPIAQTTKTNGPESIPEQIEMEFTIGKTTIEIRQGNIEKQTDVEVIVNAANKAMQGGGGVDAAIGGAAGRGIYKECIELLEGLNYKEAREGEAYLTSAGKLNGKDKLKHIIHTAGPHGNLKTHPNRKTLLRDSYYNCLVLAHENGLKSIAFPAISIGVFNYPIQEAAEVQLNAVKEFCKNYPDTSIEKIRLVYWQGDTVGRESNKLMVQLCTPKDSKEIEEEPKAKEKPIEFRETDKELFKDLLSRDLDSLPVYGTAIKQEGFPKPELVTDPIMKGTLEDGRPFIIVKLIMPVELLTGEKGESLVMGTHYSYVGFCPDRNKEWVGFSFMGQYKFCPDFGRDKSIKEDNTGFELLKKLISEGGGLDLGSIAWTLSA